MELWLGLWSFKSGSVFFKGWNKYRQMAIFFSKTLILAILKKKTHFLIAKIFIQFDHFPSNSPFFIHLSKFSSNYDDSIQNLDESAALFISLVPHAR
jgi:hypothetical protein